MLYFLADLLPQMLPGSRNVRHVFIQDVLLGADTIILNVLGPVQLAHVKVKRLQDRKPDRRRLRHKTDFWMLLCKYRSIVLTSSRDLTV